MSMPGTFDERIRHLSDAVGHGTIVAKDKVDQVYAGYQEFRDDLEHRVGKAHALRDAVIDHTDSIFQEFADALVTPDGSDLRGAAERVCHQIDEHREENTPILFHNLIRSGHVSVVDDGETVYDRPPDVPRLSEEQLRAQRRRGHSLDYGADTRPRGTRRVS